MKKIILILILMFSIGCSYAASQYSSILDKVENSIFGFTYTTQDDISRLNRIEQSVYGQEKFNKTTAERIADLKKDMSADLIGHEITPKEDTFMEEEDYYKQDKLAQEKLPPAGANVDYPAINELEKQLFKQEFKNKSLDDRLASLEKKAFNTTYSNEDFSTRVDRLRGKLKPKSIINNGIAQSSNSFFDDDVVELDRNYKLDGYQPPEFDYDAYNAKNSTPKKVNLSAVEKTVLSRSFQNDSVENRISRLESTMFGTTFDSEPQQERINRIASAYKAQKTASKYDSNKMTQNMATAMQIGTLILMILACVL